MDITEIRKQIDEVDNDILRAFQKRMELARDVAKYKSENNMPVFDPARERQILSKIAEKTDEGMAKYASALYSVLFDISRSYQDSVLKTQEKHTKVIEKSIKNTAKIFPKNAVVACQGIEGAYSQLACQKLFTTPNIMFCCTFESVFAAIDSGLCRYGILPLENSTAGSINRVYDLMMKHNFSIVRSVRLKIDHNLLAKKGSSISDIKEIYTHEQAANQCVEFLKSLNIKVSVCENTAVAAQMVANSPRNDVAALSSRSCADIYALECLASSIQDKGNNYTRFICISKELEIYPGADKTSIMMTIAHRPGSLYRVLSRFFALGINLIKLESRPIPSRDFEFMFYFDLETPVYSPELIQLINDLDGLCEEYKYLGTYMEII